MWGCILSLVNQLLRFPLTSEYNDALDALEDTCRATGEVIGIGEARQLLVGRY